MVSVKVGRTLCLFHFFQHLFSLLVSFSNVPSADMVSIFLTPHCSMLYAILHLHHTLINNNVLLFLRLLLDVSW